MTIRSRLAWRTKTIRRVDNDSLSFWLQDRGSLTTHLQTKGTFSVKLLKQSLAKPTLDEAVALGIARNQLAWIREVALLCDGEPLVFAHTVLPYRPRGPLSRWLSRLGNQSLGALLFAHPGFRREALSCKRLDHRHALFLPAAQAMDLARTPPQTLWVRRSAFAFGAQTVLVTEVFSPAISRK